VSTYLQSHPRAEHSHPRTVEELGLTLPQGSSGPRSSWSLQWRSLAFGAHTALSCARPAALGGPPRGRSNLTLEELGVAAVGGTSTSWRSPGPSPRKELVVASCVTRGSTPLALTPSLVQFGADAAAEESMCATAHPACASTLSVVCTRRCSIRSWGESSELDSRARDGEEVVR
jgi:hypothetical protein